MKKYLVTLAAGLLTGLALSVWAAQDTDITNVEVRDPIRLEAYLEANASDAQTRVAALEAADVVLGTNSVAASRLTGNITLARLTNALSSTLYSGTITNAPTGTNVMVILNGVVVSVTQNP
jgi:hypothetical protein